MFDVSSIFLTLEVYNPFSPLAMHIRIKQKEKKKKIKENKNRFTKKIQIKLPKSKQKFPSPVVRTKLPQLKGDKISSLMKINDTYSA